MTDQLRTIARYLAFSLTAALAAAHGQSIKTGPAVGEKIPDFSAQDQSGHEQTLKSIMGPKGAMLVFFRSADW
ncbi:MAG: hypothetical protein JOZ32_17685 [Bryobacterales bacterium]|nr:hypothetical protein [Bryobacterales bacterium]